MATTRWSESCNCLRNGIDRFSFCAGLDLYGCLPRRFFRRLIFIERIFDALRLITSCHCYFCQLCPWGYWSVLWLGRKGQSAKGYYAAHGEIHWFVNGIAFAGDYLSAASFLGICGMIAFYGYDGFLYSIGFLAGWIVAAVCYC